MGSVLRMGVRRARRAMLLAGVAFAAVPAGCALADTTIGQTGGSAAHAAGGCGFSYIAVTVHNQTTLGMHPYFFDYGPTNSVCDDQHPGSIQPGATSHWKVGDILFGTSAEIRYRFTNGDEVELTAFVYPGERNPSLACGWTQVVTAPRAFDCRANWVSGAVTGKADVELRVFPVAGTASVGAARPRSNVVGGCAHGSALIGKTTNKTG